MAGESLPDSEARQLQIIGGIAQALNSTTRIDEALQTTLAKLAKWFHLETGWVWLLQPETEEPYLAAAQNLPPALTDNPAEMEGSCYCLDTFQSDDLDDAANVSIITCSRLRWLQHGTAGLRYHASVPLYAHGRKMGVLNLASQDWRELSAGELDLLYTIGDMLGVALERAQLFDDSAYLGAVEERNRLAREIHDTLAQDLAGLTLQLESADVLLEKGADPHALRAIIQRALEMSRQSLDEVQRSVLDLRAAPLVDRSLSEALAQLVKETGDRGNIAIDYEHTGGPRPLPARIEIGLYRIAQEALNNVVNHAGATKVIVRLNLQPDQIELVIQDNGAGFDPGRIGEGSFGLIGINERARLLAGTFKLESAPGEGTRVEIIIANF